MIGKPLHHLEFQDCNEIIQNEMVLHMKRRAILAVLRAYEWNQSKAADALGLSEEGLRHVIKDAHLHIDNMDMEHLQPLKERVER